MRRYKDYKQLIKVAIFSFFFFIQISCSQQHKDKEAKADITVKAKSDPAFAGVLFVIDNGTITLTGICPTQASKAKVESTVKDVYSIEKVVNNITIAPVIIGTDQALKQSVDSVLGSYAGVEAIVKDSTVQLQGQMPAKDEQKLLTAIKSLRPENTISRIIAK